MIKKLFFGFIMLGALTMVYMSLHYFQHQVTGIMKGKEISSATWYRYVLRTHILFGVIAIMTGPFQFIRQLRLNRPALHKRIGYLYVLCIGFSGISGLIIAQFAMGGIISSTGFSTLAIAWLMSTGISIRAITRGDIKTHQLFMMFSYSLTWAAVPQRSMLALALITDIPFITIYKCTAWLPWIFNMAVAYFIFHKFQNSKSISHA